MDYLLEQVERIEYDFKHWNQSSSISNARKLMQSPEYNKLPIKAKLTLYYYQLNYIGYLWFFDPESEFFDLLDKFDREFDPNQIQEKEIQLFYYTIKIQVLIFKNESKQATTFEIPCKALISELESAKGFNKDIKKYIALFYLTFSKILLRTSRYEEELSNLLKSFKLWEELNDCYNRFYCTMNIMGNYGRNGNIEEQIHFLELNYDYFREEKQAEPIYAREILMYLAESYMNSDLKIALKYIEEALEGIDSPQPEKEEEKSILYSKIHGNFVKGWTLMLMGKIEESIKASKVAVQSLEKLQQLNFNQNSMLYSLVLSTFGEAIAESGDVDLALKYQLQAFNERMKAYKSKLSHFFSPEYRLADSYYKLICLQLKLGHSNEAQKYLTEFDNLTQKETTKELNYYKTIIVKYKLAKGLFYKNEGSFEDIVQAKILLKEIITEDVSFELKADSLIPLIDITIQEYKIFQNQKIYLEIVALISRLEEIGEKNNSATLKINSLLLEGKIDLIQGNIEKAEVLFKKSQNIAQEFKIADLIKKSTLELDNLQHDKANWEQILNNTSIKDRFEFLHVEDYIKEGKQYLSFNKGNE